MLFNSVEFVLIFLPVTLLGFVWFSRRSLTAGIWWLIVASLAFYAREEWRYVALMIGTILGNYLLGHWIGRNRSGAVLALGVSLNLGLLAWFKYSSFVATSINDTLHAGLTIPHVVLPLAISFFTFQQIAYLADIRRGVAPAQNLGQSA